MFCPFFFMAFRTFSGEYPMLTTVSMHCLSLAERACCSSGVGLPNHFVQLVLLGTLDTGKFWCVT